MLTMTQVAKKILVTCALPYANGSIHLGHMLEHIQADVWVRYQRMRGHEVNFICADDAHGTPIMLKSAAARYHTGADDWRDESGASDRFCRLRHQL